MNNAGFTASLTKGLPQPGCGSFSILLASAVQTTQSTTIDSVLVADSGLGARGSFRPASEESQDDEADRELQLSDPQQTGGASERQTAQPLTASGVQVSAAAASLPVIAKLVLRQATVTPASSAGPNSGGVNRDQKTQPGSSKSVSAGATAGVAAQALEKSQIAVPGVIAPVSADPQPVATETGFLDTKTTAAKATLMDAASREANLRETTGTAVSSAAATVRALNQQDSKPDQTAAIATPSQTAAQTAATVAPEFWEGMTVTTVLPKAIILPALDGPLPSGVVGAIAGKGATTTTKPQEPIGSKDAATSSTQGSSNNSSAITQATTTQSTSQGSGSPGGNQSQTRTSSDGSLVQAATVKAGDSATPLFQTQAAPPLQAGPETAPLSRNADAGHAMNGADNPATTTLPGEGTGAPVVGINTARLIQTMNETGMQVGMRSPEFGDISIHTSVSQQQMFTQIAVEHADLGRAISAHIPAVQAKLGDELGVQASIEVGQSSTGFAGDRGYSSQQQEPAPVIHLVDTNGAIVAEIDGPSLAAVAAPVDKDRLDIRA